MPERMPSIESGSGRESSETSWAPEGDEMTITSPAEDTGPQVAVVRERLNNNAAVGHVRTPITMSAEDTSSHGHGGGHHGVNPLKSGWAILDVLFSHIWQGIISTRAGGGGHGGGGGHKPAAKSGGGGGHH